MEFVRKPLYLLSDSQLLFLNRDTNKFISSIQESLRLNEKTVTKAAYIGASNGDDPAYFELFMAAMDNINTHECKMISSSFSASDLEFLKAADLILLAGGDFEKGWSIIKNKGMADIITEKFYSGCVIVGISAGAVQIGMGGMNSKDVSCFTDTLRLIPYYIDVHDEQDSWTRLKRIVHCKDEYSKGFGISAGGGLIYYPDCTVEPLRIPTIEIQKSTNPDNSVVANILLPPEEPCATALLADA